MRLAWWIYDTDGELVDRGLTRKLLDRELGKRLRERGELQVPDPVRRRGTARAAPDGQPVKFYCVCRYSDKKVSATVTVDADNGIEALRTAALRTKHSGVWTAYREAVTKQVDVKRDETYRVVLSDPVKS